MHIHQLIKNNQGMKGPLADQPWGLALIGTINAFCEEYGVLDVDADIDELNQYIDQLPKATQSKLLTTVITNEDTLTGHLYQMVYESDKDGWSLARVIVVMVVPFLVGGFFGWAIGNTGGSVGVLVESILTLLTVL